MGSIHSSLSLPPSSLSRKLCNNPSDMMKFATLVVVVLLVSGSTAQYGNGAAGEFIENATSTTPS